MYNKQHIYSTAKKKVESSFNGSYGNRSKDVPANFNGNAFRDLSRDEKRQLRKKIKIDLQQVRSLSQKLQAREFEVRSSLQNSARSTINGSTTNGHYFPSVAESSLREGTRVPPKKPSVKLFATNPVLSYRT